MAMYNMQCPMALRRLKEVGMPATLEHGVRKDRDATASTAIAVAETVQHFITAMDSLKLNMVAVDQIYPLLSDLVQSMMKVGEGGEAGGGAGGVGGCRCAALGGGAAALLLRWASGGASRSCRPAVAAALSPAQPVSSHSAAPPAHHPLHHTCPHRSRRCRRTSTARRRRAAG